MADTDLDIAYKLTPSLVEQLDKALIELEARKEGVSDTVSLTEITKHFRDLEAKMMDKYAELEAKEKAFKQEQSDAYILLAEKEAAVAAKEQDIENRIQVLNDADVAALAKSRPNDVPPSVDTDDIVNATEKKVTSSLDEANVCPEEVTFHQELTQYCEQMDTDGLVSFITKNKKNITVLSEELSDALKSSPDPCRLILDSLDGFYPFLPDGHNYRKDTALWGTRQSCINLMKAMNAMLANSDAGPDHLLTYEIKHQAKAIADEWFPKLDRYGIIDATNGKSIEAEAFLQLLVTFRIVSEFADDHLCKLVLAVSERREVPELCRSLDLAHKMPGVIDELISRGKLISAVHFVHAFDLVDRFPTVPLLMTYLKDLRRRLQTKRIRAPDSEGVQNELNNKEREALRDVIDCIEKYNLKADYPLEPLQRRVGHLEKAKSDRKRLRESTSKPPPNRKRPRESTSKPRFNRKRPRESTNKPPYNRKKRSNEDRVYGHRHLQAPAPVYMDRRPYAAPPQNMYPQVNPYDYHTAFPPPTQTPYSQHVYDQNAYYYPPDVGVAAPPPQPPPPTYSGYTGSSVPPSYQPYM